MINIKKFDRLIAIFLTGVALALLIYLALAYVATHAIGLVYSSDIISVPYLYKDLFYHGGHWAQWYFATTMGFFPDMFVYFPLAALLGSAKIALSYFAVYQFLLYFILLTYLGKSVTKSENKTIHIFCISALLTFLLYDSGYLQQNVFYAAAISGHFGTACMFLLGTVFINNTIKYKGMWQYINYGLLGLLCLLTVFSDLLFLTQFVATAFVSLFIIAILSEKEKRNVYRINLVVMITSSIISFACLKNAHSIFGINIAKDSQVIRRSTPHQLLVAMEYFIKKLTIFYRHDAIILLLLVCFFMVSLVFGCRLLIDRAKNVVVAEEDKPFIFTICMLFVSIIAGYFSQIFLDNVLVSNDPSLRSFQPFILFPVFLGIPLYLAHYSNLGVLVKKYYKSILVSIICCALLFIPLNSIKPLLYYYPSKAECIDHFALKYHLSNGVGQYWDAKLYSFLSKQNVDIAAVTFNQHKQLMPYWWYNTKNSYINKTFNFVIVDDIPGSPISAQAVVRSYGVPQKILQCSKISKGQTELYLYPDGIITKNWKMPN